MDKEIEKYKVDKIGDALLGVDYKKQYQKRLLITIALGSLAITFTNVILGFVAFMTAIGTIESYYKHKKT